MMFTEDRTYMEWFKTVYKGHIGKFLIAEPLVQVDNNFDLLPAGAERWEVSDNGLTWIFHLRRGSQVHSVQSGHLQRG